MVRKLEKQLTREQASILAKYSITNHQANSIGLARWQEKMRNGAWERQNYIENFGEEETEAA